MKHKQVASLLSIIGLLSFIPVHAEDNSMSFFVSSAGSGKGGDLGGLQGADAHCQKLATAADAGVNGEPTLVQRKRVNVE